MSTESGSCSICNYSAEGFHFCAHTCKACAAFFRRSCAENKRYRCRESGNCIIKFENRNNCRSCRLKKCFKSGMKKECVDALSGRFSSSSPSPSSLSPITMTLPLYKFEKMHSTFLEWQISIFKFTNPRVPMFSENNQFIAMNIENHNQMEKGSADLIATLLTENFPILRFLTKNEKQKIFGPFAVKFINLHRCWMTAKYFPSGEKIAFHYGIYYHFDEIEKLFGEEAKNEEIFKLIQPIIKTLRRFSQKLGKLNLSDLERGALITLIFYQQMEHLQLLVPSVNTTQQELLIQLHTHLTQSYGLTSGGLRFANVVGLLTNLEIIANDWSNMVILGNLVIPHYREIFILLSDTLSPK